MKINAVKTDGGWLAVAGNGELIFEGRTFRTRRELYEALDRSYNDRFWEGRKVRSGYYINADVL